jgi:uncharacterized protein YebE (UPF0316 family)
MLPWLNVPPEIMPLIIFSLRVTDMSLDTLRVLFIIRGNRPLAWITGFFQSLIWVIAISGVLTNLTNVWNIVAYAAGFATGNVVGMTIEERLAIGHRTIRVISSSYGPAISTSIREAGYPATELAGRGKDGVVSIIISSLRRRDVEKVRRMVMEIDNHAFITLEDVRPLNRGFWRA